MTACLSLWCACSAACPRDTEFDLLGCGWMDGRHYTLYTTTAGWLLLLVCLLWHCCCDTTYWLRFRLRRRTQDSIPLSSSHWHQDIGGNGDGLVDIRVRSKSICCAISLLYRHWFHPSSQWVIAVLNEWSYINGPITPPPVSVPTSCSNWSSAFFTSSCRPWSGTAYIAVFWFSYDNWHWPAWGILTFFSVLIFWLTFLTRSTIVANVFA